MSNNIPYHSLRSAAKERPLLSVFLGSFLTASVIPMIVFLMIIMGSLTIGVLAFTAFQSGVIVIASIVLCVCLVLPLFLSSVFALLAYCGLVVVNAVGWSLKESSNRQRLSVSYITARLRSAITNASPFRYFMTGNIDARGEDRCGFAQVAYNIFRNLIRGM